MKVLCDNNIFLSIGPDCITFVKLDVNFICAFLFCCLLSSIHIYSLLGSKIHVLIIIFNVIICGGQCCIYLYLGLINPGIVQESDAKLIVDFNFTKHCRKCNFRVPLRSRHCDACDVCIL